MTDTPIVAELPAQHQVAAYDAIVIGAGISGMFMLYRLRELGFIFASKQQKWPGMATRRFGSASACRI